MSVLVVSELHGAGKNATKLSWQVVPEVAGTVGSCIHNPHVRNIISEGRHETKSCRS